eukprot:2532349-Alexandrium_andersonii.AAC.1
MGSELSMEEAAAPCRPRSVLVLRSESAQSQRSRGFGPCALQGAALPPRPELQVTGSPTSP